MKIESSKSDPNKLMHPIVINGLTGAIRKATKAEAAEYKARSSDIYTLESYGVPVDVPAAMKRQMRSAESLREELRLLKRII